jgi:hypothetical protein
MSVKFSNNGKTTLSSGVLSSATTIDVADASVFPSITGSEYFYMTLENVSGNVEILKVTSVSSNTLTAVRAQDGTSAISFAAGDKAENRLTAGGLNDVATQADTDTDTTYSVEDGGLTEKNFTSGLKTKLDGIEASANNYSHPSAHAISFITGLQTALDGKVDDSQVLTDVPENAVFTDTTYSVEDGGLTQKNFTTTLKTKLDGIATSANNYSHPSAHTISFITGLQTALDGKVDDSQVLTDVPGNAVFTDTTYSVEDGGLTQKNFTTTLKTKLDGIATNANNYSLPFTDNSTNWNTAYGWGDHSSGGYLTSHQSLSGYATETYVGNQITALVDSSPSALNTLNELAAALGDDANFSTTVTNSIATKLPLAGGTLTGNLAINKTSPEITLYDTNNSTGSFPKINFTTTNNQGVSLYHNEFDNELPVDGYGLVLDAASGNSQYPTTGTLSLVVKGEIYAGSTTLADTKKVGTQSVVTTAPTSASGFPNGHVWYVVS